MGTEFLIASRTARPGDDPIFALNAEAQARQRAGEHIVNATVGALLEDDGTLAVIPSVVEAIRSLSPRVGAAYAPISGPPEFLRAVIEDLLGGTTLVDAAVAVATPGGTGALRHAVANFLEPNQSLLTTSFYWGPYKTLADEGDRHMATFRMFDDQGRFDHRDLERKLQGQLETQGRVLLVLNSPCHNPTGYSMDDAEWSAVAQILRDGAPRGPIALVCDVAYARYGVGAPMSFLAHIAPLAGEVMLLFAWSGSKAFTQYGARVGSLVAVHPDPAERLRVANALGYSCRGTWSNCNALGMAAVTRILTDPELRARVDRERASLRGLLERRVSVWNELAPAHGLRYPRYDGGFFVTVFCDDAPAAAARLKEEGVFVVPLAGALRVGLCSVAERDVPRLVEALGRHVGAASSSPG